MPRPGPDPGPGSLRQALADANANVGDDRILFAEALDGETVTLTSEQLSIFDPDGSGIERKIFPLLGPNGIGLSPDETTLYVADTPTGRLWAYRIVEPGALDREPRPEGVCLANTLGHFDSLAVDGEGWIAVATLGANPSISAFSPDGSESERFPMPDPLTTNICFGGEDGRTAYVTLSGTGQLVTFDWPRPGGVLHFSA